MIPKLIKSPIRLTPRRPAIYHETELTGDPADILRYAQERFENGQLIFHIGSKGGVGAVIWQKRLDKED